MRYELYQTFYQTLRKFVHCEDFTIEFEFLREKYSLGFRKNGRYFYVDSTYKSIQKPQTVYPIIKKFVDSQIAKNQKLAFGAATQEKENFFERISLTEEENETFLYLVDKFKTQLWEEPISPYDITVKGCYHRLGYGFADCNVSAEFLSDILKIFHMYPNSFGTGKIDFYMWQMFDLNKEVYQNSINQLKEDGYATVEDNVEAYGWWTVRFTEKFYEAFKKSFYYDYDPQIVRPTGCCFNM